MSLVNCKYCDRPYSIPDDAFTDYDRIVELKEAISANEPNLLLSTGIQTKTADSCLVSEHIQ